MIRANITTEALNGDRILVDGDQGIVHLRPDEMVANAFRDKIAMEDAERYSAIRDDATVTKDGTAFACYERRLNGGLAAKSFRCRRRGLFRTELQFLVRSKMPQRSELSSLYKRVMDAADETRGVSHVGHWFG